MDTITRTDRITLHLDEGLPVIRGGEDVRGRVLARGKSLTAGTPRENATYIRRVLRIGRRRKL